MWSAIKKNQKKITLFTSKNKPHSSNNDGGGDIVDAGTGGSRGDSGDIVDGPSCSASKSSSSQPSHPVDSFNSSWWVGNYHKTLINSYVAV